MLEIDGKKFQTMMPIADLFNFSPSRVNTEWKYNNETHNFEITASKDIKKGDEVKYLKNKFRSSFGMGIMIIITYSFIMALLYKIMKIRLNIIYITIQRI